MPNILYLDIETAPKLAYVYRFFKENISPKQVKEHGYIISFAAIWNDSPDKEVIYQETRTEDDRELVAQLIGLLDRADIVIGHNVEYFDAATINARALVLGLKPPSPYKVVDTYKAAKRYFKFESNSLEYISGVLNIKHKKLSHNKFPGFELWIECMKGNPDAFKENKKYNCWDTFSTRDVYKEMRPWIRNHPNMAVYDEENSHVCPGCGGKHLHSRGYSYTNTGKYQKFHCQDCGKWSRTRYSERNKDAAKGLLTNA